MNVSLHLSRCLRNAVWFLTLLCALALAACTQDDDAVGGAPVEVRLAVTADHEETLPVRQTTGEEAGDEQEYMHELCVFIVDETGTIEHRLLPDLSDDADAQRGNLQQWTSYPILLTPGEKTLYAFANWSMADNDEWTQLLSQTEGAIFNVGLLKQVALDDPAAKLDFGAGRFIPMAASTTVTVTASTRELRIGLDRLVSKLRLTARLDKGVGIRGCTFEGVATQCHLLGIAPAGRRTKSYTMPDPTLVDGTYVFPDVYINATYGTEGTEPFTVTLVTDKNAGTTYTAQTDRKEVPRNSIYPLNLTLSPFAPRIVVRSWVSPIGHYPVEVKTDFDANAFEVSLAEGSQFEFSIDGIDGAADATNIAAVWRLPATTPAGVVFDGTADGTASDALTVKGHLTTLPVGSTFTLGVDVSWTAGGKHYGRHYTLTVRIKDITDVVFKQPTRRLLPAEWLWMD